ncbi:sensor histidine kinase [Pseudonocardia kunmingensis]|uniref:histidine kinase n=1 Tax=Pseudonocardia kunmingensis TaxID=630975 RepID=A0A543CYD8_9PSEU|nr:sensor histidine kinase [Pseudonocardia kunmingensis]TQM02091.1 signal transduction histidine kinase [Pseudonocardia kunmingensis]
MRTAARRGWWAGPLPTVVLPLAVGAFSVVGTFGAARGQPVARPLDALGVALLLTGAAALVVRRRHPTEVLAVAATAAGLYLGLGYPYGPVFLASLVALCSAVLAGHRRGAYAVTATAFVALLVVHLIRFPDQPLPLFGAGGWLSSLAVVIALCEWWRARRERLAQEQLTREETERRRGSEERLRIARDLHDSLGHHVSLINVQAGVALHLMDDDPEQVRFALAAIKQSSGELLREMRSTLGVLRGVDEGPPRTPVAGLARLEDLLAENRAAGLPVELEVVGERRELPPSVDQAAYRIVQESLTNTRRHAGPARARVALHYTGDDLEVRVEDDGPGAPAPAEAPGGNGLPGMRERAAALGGTLDAGPRPTGGFRVHARLPAPASRLDPAREGTTS